MIRKARPPLKLLIDLAIAVGPFLVLNAAWGQGASIAVGSGAATPGSGVTVPVTLTTTGAPQPSGLQWTMAYSSADVSIVTVSAGPNATAAGKSVTCSSLPGSTTCVAYGMNSNVVSDGTLASVTFTIASGAVDTSAPIQVTGVMAADTSGGSIPGTGVTGAITITQPVQPTLTGFSCTPATVAPAGVAACTVTLSSAALVGGFGVVLGSNNAYLNVPSSLTVSAGTTSAGFSGSVAVVVPTSQTATLTVSAAGTTKAYSINITASTWSISGSLGTAGSGATVALGGISTASTTADASGNYSFAGLVNGSYNVTPTKSGYSFNPPSLAVTVSGANVAAVNFTVQAAVPTSIAIDANVSFDRSTSGSSIAVSHLSTVAGNELLLAFVATGNRTGKSTNVMVSGVSGGGLTWALVRRTRYQKGTAEIWRAFAPATLGGVTITATLSQSVAASMTVMSFTGVNITGTNGSGAIGATASGSAASGAPHATLIATHSNSLVIGVGTDTQQAISRTVGAGQSLVHQYLASVGDTYWVQRVDSQSAPSGSSVSISDSAPTGDRYDLSIAEILAAPTAAGLTTSLTTPVTSAAAAGGAIQGGGLMSPASPVLSKVTTGEAGEACSPGGLASLIGRGLTGRAAARSTSFPLPTRLAGVEVQVNGAPAPLLLASDTQINFQCPMLSAGSEMTIRVESETGFSTPPIQTVMQAAVPLLFQLDAMQRGLVTIAGTNEIAMARTEAVPSRPAKRGEDVTIYASGLGAVVDGVPVGNAAPVSRAVPIASKVSVVIGDVEIDPEFAGLEPGTAGLFQVKVTVSADVPTGAAVPLYLKMTLPDGTIVRSNTVNVAVAAAAGE